MPLSTLATINQLVKYKRGNGPIYAYTGSYTFSSNGSYAYILKCTGSGTLTVGKNTTVNYYIVAGGASGGIGKASSSANSWGACGGGGGQVFNSSFSNSTPGTTYVITIGQGGAGQTTAASDGNNGGNTTLVGGSQNITANGGLGGYHGLNGSCPSPATQSNAATGGQGDNTGTAQNGQNGLLQCPIDSVYYAGAGGGSVRTGTPGSGGTYGGTAGKKTSDAVASDNCPNNSGSGSGGSYANGGSPAGNSGNGGSGICFIYFN